MCPDCGGTDTGVINASHDAEGNRIRRRACRNCDVTFATVEVPFPFSFHEADADKRASPAYSARIKQPEYEPAWFEVEFVRVTQPRRRQYRNGRKGPAFRPLYPDDEAKNAVLVTLKRSNKYPRCRKGIHVMRGKNIYHHPRGHQVCNACRRAAANALYRDHLSPVTSVSARRRREEAA